jgi:hypothetical protein
LIFQFLDLNKGLSFGLISCSDAGRVVGDYSSVGEIANRRLGTLEISGKFFEAQAESLRGIGASRSLLFVNVLSRSFEAAI